MARTEIPLVVLHPDTGFYVEDADVTITARPGGGAVDVYNAETAGTIVTQPLTTDAQGRVTGWVERGRYTATIEVSGFAAYPIYFESSPGADGSVTTTWIADDAVTNAKLADDAVDSPQIADGAIDTVHIGNDQVTSTKLGTSAVTTAKIADDAVDSAKLRDDPSTDANRAVTTNHIRNSAVTTAKIADTNVTTAKIADANVTAPKLGLQAADAAQGKVNLGWWSSNRVPTSGNFAVASSTWTTITGCTLTAVPSGIYLAIPRLTFLPSANTGTNAYTAEARLWNTSGSVAFGGEPVTIGWYATDGGKSRKPITLPQFVWVVSTADIALQVRSPANALESLVAQDSAKFELTRIV